MGLGLAFHLHFNVEIKNNFCYFKPDRRTILGIYAIGLPAIISQALLTVMTYSLNLILGGIPQVGQNAVTVYGLYYKIQQLIIFAAFGVRDAITPIVSFNYGAQNRQRVKDGIRWGLITPRSQCWQAVSAWSCSPPRWPGCSRCPRRPYPCASTVCASSRWALCLPGCALPFRACFRHWNAASNRW